MLNPPFTKPPFVNSRALTPGPARLPGWGMGAAWAWARGREAGGRRSGGGGRKVGGGRQELPPPRELAAWRPRPTPLAWYAPPIYPLCELCMSTVRTLCAHPMRAHHVHTMCTQTSCKLYAPNLPPTCN